MEIAIGGELQDDFTPAKVDSGNLFEKSGGGLEDNGVGERHDSSGGFGIGGNIAQFEQVKTHQSDVNDFAGNRAYLDAVSHPNAVFSDQEEVTDNRHNDVLKGHGHAGGDQASEGRHRSDFGDESKDQ